MADFRGRIVECQTEAGPENGSGDTAEISGTAVDCGNTHTVSDDLSGVAFTIDPHIVTQRSTADLIMDENIVDPCDPVVLPDGFQLRQF